MCKFVIFSQEILRLLWYISGITKNSYERCQISIIPGNCAPYLTVIRAILKTYGWLFVYLFVLITLHRHNYVHIVPFQVIIKESTQSWVETKPCQLEDLPNLTLGVKSSQWRAKELQVGGLTVCNRYDLNELIV